MAATLPTAIPTIAPVDVSRPRANSRDSDAEYVLDFVSGSETVDIDVCARE
jgi:hypothetical protein